MPLSVLTLNVWHEGGPYADRLPLLRTGLSALDADIIGLQEVMVGAGHNQLDDLFPDLADRHWAFASGRPDELDERGRAEGIALIARWPILEPTTVRLPDLGSGSRRVALTARVASPHGEILVVVTHLTWRLDAGVVREAQVIALAELMVSTNEAFPPVLLGDLNAESESAEIRYLQGLQSLAGRSTHLRDAWRAIHGAKPGFTWSVKNPHARWSLEPERRLDYVFVGSPDPSVSHRGHVLDAQLAFTEVIEGVAASDHFGVWAQLATETVSFD